MTNSFSISKFFKKLLTFYCLLFAISCGAQEVFLKDLSDNEEMNYHLARIYPETPEIKSIFSGGIYLLVYKLSDSKATPESYSEGDEFLDSILLSIVPDGDAYTESKLFKIEGLIDPILSGVNELEYPDFQIFIDHGIQTRRRVDTITLSADFD